MFTHLLDEIETSVEEFFYSCVLLVGDLYYCGFFFGLFRDDIEFLMVVWNF